ncbi:hypothetical protein [Micromonospora endolithica]|uniref:Proteinase inhibitor I4 serpin n=1 Tax=Micromonospora endolithica TaxID=230091 RepID=A0A3A9ZSG5_9ACTN|nr:hypothetical protein [Micromonospora endolithica]RKN51135.1 hypothetical protein D7223_05350 [Micromonospora endolithica]TWJ22336.1 hypothetical protein JD76_02451 [Micromonospora endolithica]
MTDLRSPVARYASRLHAVLGDRHHVASPLGAWLLLALSAPAATDRSRDDLATVLGMDASAAADAARALLDRPHPLVGAASGVWHGTGCDAGRLDAWRATLPAGTAVGPLPEPAELDAWAREHSLGLIEEFPIRVGPDLVLLLASALATRISWADPFEVDDAAALGAGSPWAGRLARVLRTPQRGHHCWIASTPRAGEVIVHAAPARPADDGAGLLVVSVAAHPDVPAVDVLAAAHDIALRAADAPDGHRPGSLYDLPLGVTPLWTLREEVVHTNAPGGRDERLAAVLPAWSARDTHDLATAELGFPAAAEGLADLLGGGRFEVEVKQATAARFGRHGFEAAAVTGFAMRTSLPPEGVVRVAELRFGHPYAAVAVATDQPSDAPAGPWHGVPVFSAWVAEPQELTEADLADPPTEW